MDSHLLQIISLLIPNVWIEAILHDQEHCLILPVDNASTHFYDCFLEHLNLVLNPNNMVILVLFVWVYEALLTNGKCLTVENVLANPIVTHFLFLILVDRAISSC